MCSRPGASPACSRVSIASSNAVYAGLPHGPFQEDMNVRLRAGFPTEAFKKAFEVLGLHYRDRTGLEVACLRVNVYGPLYHSMSNLPSRLVHAAVQGQAGPLPRPGGRPDFAEDAANSVYVKDCAEGIRLVHTGAEARPRRLQYRGGKGGFRRRFRCRGQNCGARRGDRAATRTRTGISARHRPRSRPHRRGIGLSAGLFGRRRDHGYTS